MTLVVFDGKQLAADSCRTFGTSNGSANIAVKLVTFDNLVYRGEKILAGATSGSVRLTERIIRSLCIDAEDFDSHMKMAVALLGDPQKQLMGRVLLVGETKSFVLVVDNNHFEVHSFITEYGKNILVLGSGGREARCVWTILGLPAWLLVQSIGVGKRNDGVGGAVLVQDFLTDEDGKLKLGNAWTHTTPNPDDAYDAVTEYLASDNSSRKHRVSLKTFLIPERKVKKKKEENTAEAKPAAISIPSPAVVKATTKRTAKRK
jgi:hypothetical protein